MRAVGQRIKAIRRDKHLTREQLAAMINYSPDGLKNFESGTRNAAFHVLTRIASALDVPMSVLTGEEEYRPRDLARGDRSHEESDRAPYHRAEDWTVAQIQAVTHHGHDAILIVYHMGQVERVCIECKTRETIA